MVSGWKGDGMKRYGVYNATHDRMCTNTVYRERSRAFLDLKSLRDSDPEGEYRLVSIEVSNE